MQGDACRWQAFIADRIEDETLPAEASCEKRIERLLKIFLDSKKRM
ncbi:MAG: hypothetical protein II998_06775 [Clostridia bacterium]|nr:hypothetical protein [Clostridia bacterium]